MVLCTLSRKQGSSLLLMTARFVQILGGGIQRPPQPLCKSHPIEQSIKRHLVAKWSTCIVQPQTFGFKGAKT